MSTSGGQRVYLGCNLRNSEKPDMGSRAVLSCHQTKRNLSRFITHLIGVKKQATAALLAVTLMQQLSPAQTPQLQPGQLPQSAPRQPGQPAIPTHDIGWPR